MMTLVQDVRMSIQAYKYVERLRTCFLMYMIQMSIVLFIAPAGARSVLSVYA